MPTQDGNMAANFEAAMEIDKGSIELSFCKNCGFIRNEDYDAAKISFDSYDFSNDHSPLFRAYVDQLTTRLLERYQLKHKLILDVGCGDGVFLQMLCEKGKNKGIGIDPGFDHSKRKLKEGLDVSFHRMYYSAEQADLRPDFVACRLVVDLLEDATQFISMLRHNLEGNPDTIVYFEVPNALYTFEERIIWNVIYEHAAWYTPTSLRYQFEYCGFEVLDVSPCWKGEFLGIEARIRPMHQEAILPSTTEIQAIEKTIAAFDQDFQNLLLESEQKIKAIQANKIKTLAWGAGARAVTFFNLFDITKDIPYIVDINTKRQGKFVPGSGQEIVAPEFIRDYQPDLVLITNPTYAEEIKAQINTMGIAPDFWVL